MNKLKTNLLLIALTIFMVLINIDYTAVNLALVTVANDLHQNLNTTQWILSAYALAWAAVIIPAGKLADIFGRKRLAIIGLILFMLGSLFAGMAHHINTMIAGRVLQGIAGGIFIPTLYAFIHASFTKDKLGMALGILSLGIGLGMALGPTFGGLILTYIGWRWIFLINIPLCLFTLFVLLWVAQEGKVVTSEKLDKLGAILLSTSIVALMYAISKAHAWGIGSALFIFMTLGSLIILGLFVWRQFKIQQPLLDMSIFTHRTFVGTSLTLALEQFGFTTIVISLALYLQNILGYSPLASSYIFLALSLMTGLISPFGGYLIPKFGFKNPALFGMACVVIGSVWLMLLSDHPLLINILIPLCITGVGMGLALTALQTGIMTTVPEAQVGVASGVFIMLALLGNTLGVLITTLLYEAVVKATPALAFSKVMLMNVIVMLVAIMICCITVKKESRTSAGHTD